MNNKIKQYRTGFIIGTIICFLACPLAPPISLLGLICLILALVFNKKYKKLSVSTSHNPVQKEESPYIFLRFKVAGVTFKNGRKTRQAILRAFKWGDEDIESVDLEQYEYEGRPAVYVKINDQIIGNIPSDTTNTFLEYEQKYKRDNVHCEIYGGSKLDDGTRTNYGCEIYIRYLKDS